MKYKILLVVTLGIILIYTSSFKTDNLENKELQVSLPFIESINIDGNDMEWMAFPWNRLYADNLGKLPDPNDLNGFFKLAWNDSGLHFIFKVFDDKIYTDTLNPWLSDHVELFISPFRGSDDIVQLTLLPEVNETGDPHFVLTDYRKSPEIRHQPLHFKASYSKIDSFYIMEALIDIKALGINPALHSGLALQIKIGDSDQNREKNRNFLYWHPLGHSYQNSYAMFRIQFSDKDCHIPWGTSRLIITDNDIISLLVFGKNKRRLVLKKEQYILLDTIFIPDNSEDVIHIDLSHKNINIEEDSIYVYLNNKLINLHEVSLSPRLYDKLEKPPFESEIRTFLFKDKINPPSANAVLFIGSSSISRWYSLKEDFPEFEIIQRGFGGSTTKDVLLYMDKIVLPYRPSKIFYYEGDNDIGKGLSTKEIFENIKKFVSQINTNLPETQIYLISPKISLARIGYQEKYRDLHTSMNQLSLNNKMLHYIDVSSQMINSKREVNDSLFIEDGVHLNEKGYAIWKEVIKLNIDFEGN
jgi:lysophospholipase L1-like esterase